jgi:hypothetical protein
MGQTAAAAAVKYGTITASAHERRGPAVSLLRRRRLDLLHLLPQGRGQDRLSGQLRLHDEVVPCARQRAGSDGDVDYYPRCREIFIKRPEMPRTFNTPVRWSCPYDCGLCADHQQHSCLSLIEITDHCNLQCPVCYAQSGPTRQEHKTLEHIQRLIDAVVRLATVFALQHIRAVRPSTPVFSSPLESTSVLATLWRKLPNQVDTAKRDCPVV